MSTLFNIHIELVVGPTAWARFEVCHPDQWDVPATKTFALLVIVEMYDNMKQGLGFASQPQALAKQEATKIVATHPQRERLEYWLDLYTKSDGQSFTAEAEKTILDVELVNEDGNPKDKEGDPYPKATMVFTTKDPAVLSHMVTGFRFDSAMCDCRFW
jgi:hypothetical protein